ncbi:MAG: U32 family peptidase [Desulfovibrionaceae bacterium]|nr:U32 family peptidase [Desulfovibrionaceae bacterium]
MFIPELLAPAGNMERLEAAALYGADAAYLGGRDELNLRQGALGFSWDDLDRAIALKRKTGIKLYYCINAFPRQSGFSRVEESLERLAGLAVDGLIVADPGVFRMARRLAPKHELHVSTQANTCNGEAALFWSEQGAARVNLARELDAPALRETLAAMREKAPELESEVFIHGAMCLAISGQCLLSAWLNQRPGNLGQCTHPCRFEYRAVGINPDLQAPALLLEESLRQGAPLWETAWDEQGFSSFLSPHDLCLAPYLAWFCKQRVSALKIEGRMRTAPMVAQMVNVYRTALDDLAAGTFRVSAYLDELSPLSSRSLCSGFFLPNGKRRVFSEPRRNGGDTPVVARLEHEIEPGVWQVQVKARWQSSNKAEILLPGLHKIECEPGTYALENHREIRAELLHPGTPAKFYLPEGLSGNPVLSRLRPGLFVRSV